VLTTYFYDEYGHLHALERGGVRYRVGTDQIGTPRVVVDADGTIVKRVDRDTWGRVLSDSAPAFSLPIGFAGGIEDPDTGLVRFGLRDYDPETGRFTARDPAFQKGSPANLFAYADSSPAGHHDPLGLAALTGGLCVGGCVGGQFSITWEEGLGWCQEVGAGAGGGFEVDLLGKPDQGQYYVTEGSAKFGIIGGSLGVEETWCPPKGVVDTKYVGKVSAGPIAGQYDSKDGVSGLQISKAGLELGAKTVYKECDTWTWSDLAGYL
jgi:RHS repeat-associated protein